jgi:intermediate peptidase
VPSHWCEYHARTPSVLSQWARHHLTGEKVPAQLLEQALEGARPFPAIDLQNQILYSAVDQVRGEVPVMSNVIVTMCVRCV